MIVVAANTSYDSLVRKPRRETRGWQGAQQGKCSALIAVLSSVVKWADTKACVFSRGNSHTYFEVKERTEP